MKNIRYLAHGTCSRVINIVLDDENKISQISVEGGCNGNLQGISSLLIGMPATEAIKRLEGIRCGSKPTSCPDQIAQALKTNL